MSWQDILKSEGIEPVIEFIKTEMIPKMGKGEASFVEYGTLTNDVSITAMKLLREGGSSLYSQVYDEEDGVIVDLHIDDGFDLRIRNGEEYGFQYGNRFEYINKDPKIVAGLIDDFLKLIGRSDMKHGMTLSYLQE